MAQQSQLTVRTLALAMVALVLACVHAARGDGRGGISTITSGVRSSSAAHTTGIVTVRGDPWRPTTEQRSAAGRAKSAPTPYRSAAYRPRRAPSAQHDEPICIVRRGTDDPTARDPQVQREARTITTSIVLRPLPPGQYGPPAPILAAATPAPAVKAAPLARNAFYLSPVMGAGMP